MKRWSLKKGPKEPLCPWLGSVVVVVIEGKGDAWARGGNVSTKKKEGKKERRKEGKNNMHNMNNMHKVMNKNKNNKKKNKKKNKSRKHSCLSRTKVAQNCLVCDGGAVVLKAGGVNGGG